MILSRGGTTLPNSKGVLLSTITWPQVGAHRMKTARYGENTYQSALLSIQSGVKVIDCDFWWSSNDGAIVMHDETVDRTSNGTGTVASLTSAQIAALRVDLVGTGQNPQRIPTVTDLSPLKGRAVMTLEHKSASVSQVAALAASLAGMEDTIIVQSFWGTACTAWKAAGFTVMPLHNVNTDPPATLYANGYRWVGHPFTGTGTIDELALVAAAKAAGLKVCTFTAANSTEAAAAIAAGADLALQTNPSGK